jgi:hypothetical protein
VADVVQRLAPGSLIETAALAAASVADLRSPLIGEAENYWGRDGLCSSWVLSVVGEFTASLDRGLAGFPSRSLGGVGGESELQ